MSKDRNGTDNPSLLEAIKLLDGLDVFRSLDPPELSTVAEHCSWHQFRKGEVVFGKDGGLGRIFAIYTGEILITRSGDREHDISLATFVAGESFGELTLFDREPADTVARCEQDSTVLIFPAAAGAREQRLAEGSRAARSPNSDVEAFMSAHPRIAARVLHNLLAVVARRIRSTNRLIAEKTPWVQELQRQVLLDKLTGLYNASYLEQELPGLIDRTDRGTAGPRLLMIKPDNLKSLNDRYGHKAGDRTLQLMAAELQSLLGKRGVAVRYKGDVFAVVLPETGQGRAERIAEQVRIAMHGIDLSEVAADGPEPAGGSAIGSNSSSGSEHGLHITVSVGVASPARSGSSRRTAVAGTANDAKTAVNAQAAANDAKTAVPPTATEQKAAAQKAAQLVERAYEHLFSARNSGGDRICSGRPQQQPGRAGRRKQSG